LDARAAFLGHAAPALPQVLAALHGAARRRVVVLPLLLTAAYHRGTDTPGALREAQAAFPRLSIAYGEPLGPHPALLHALERRLAEADAGADGGAAGDHRVSSTAVVLAAARQRRGRPDGRGLAGGPRLARRAARLCLGRLADTRPGGGGPAARRCA